MRRTWLILPLVALLVLAGPTVPALADGQGKSDVQKQLAEARAATAKYHDVEEAVEDGYSPAGPCVQSPAGVMGIHYLNPAYFGTTPDLEHPPMLLYVQKEEGLRLVGVEYGVVDVGQPTPILFGQPFGGSMPGHEPGMPNHYDLHVWLWANNPAGMFAEFNPKIRCGP